MQLIPVGSATDVARDGSGRVLVLASLRGKARLDEGLVLVSQGRQFEVWNTADGQAACDAALDLTTALESSAQ